RHGDNARRLHHRRHPRTRRRRVACDADQSCRQGDAASKGVAGNLMKAKGKIWREMRSRARRQKAKGKNYESHWVSKERTRTVVKMGMALAMIFAFCLLPFAFCLPTAGGQKDEDK